VATSLLDHPLFRGVDAQRLEPELGRIAITHVEKGAVLNAPWGDRGLIYLVLSGHLFANKITADGRQLLLELIPLGGFDGLIAIAGRRGHFTEAGSDATVASFDIATLERLITLQPRIATNLIHMIVDRLERREAHLETVVLHDPDRQLASQLLALGEIVGHREGDRVVLDPRITHQMLADMLGIRRETVTLHLRKLALSGAVVKRGGRVTLDAAALKGIVAGHHRRQGAA
jgi:CRP-like cAMP-binding protein